MKRVIGITGIPGTGKKTISPIVASMLNFTCISLNEFAELKHCIRRSGNEILVDIDLLRESIREARLKECVVYGHLLPDVLSKSDVDFVSVLRCHPDSLKQRLIKRSYSIEKLNENLEAELIGLSLYSSIKAFGKDKVHEYDTTGKEPIKVAEMIVSDYRKGKKQSARWIDWIDYYDDPLKLRSLLSIDSTGSALT